MRLSPFIVTLLLALIPSVTLADEPEPPAVQHPTMYEAAVEAFRDGEYERAAQLFGELYKLAPDPLLLYNRAYALGRAGRYPEAIESASAAALGGMNERHDAKNHARIVAYQARLTAPAVLDESRTRPQPTSASEVTPPKRSPWLAFAIGGAVVAAAALTTTALLDGDIARTARDRDAALEAGDDASAEDALSEIEAKQQVARPLFVVGFAAAAASVAFFTIHFAWASSETTAALTPTGVRFAVRF